MTDHHSIIVYGAIDSAKALQADALRKHFELDKVYDEDCPPLGSLRDLPRTGHLILSHQQPRGYRHAISLDCAMRLLRTQPAGYPFA